MTRVTSNTKNVDESYSLKTLILNLSSLPAVANESNQLLASIPPAFSSSIPTKLIEAGVALSKNKVSSSGIPDVLVSNFQTLLSPPNMPELPLLPLVPLLPEVPELPLEPDVPEEPELPDVPLEPESGKL